MAKHSTYKLDNIATQLADINELSTLIHLLKKIGINVPEDVSGNLYSALYTIRQKPEHNDEIEKAITIKYKQGKRIAEKIFSDKSIIPVGSVKDVVWSNTPEKFKAATSENHNNNPSDIVIKYKSGYTKNEKPWFGISLKASFRGKAIGQYNSSTCKFVNGVLFYKPNQELNGLCSKSSDSIGKSIQDHVNAIKNEFYDNGLITALQLQKGAKSDVIKKTWKDYRQQNNEYFKNANTQKLNMFRECREEIIKKIEQKHRFIRTTVGKNDAIIGTVPVKNIKNSIRSYLRMNDYCGDPNYIKASALRDSVKLEYPGIYKYLPKNVSDMKEIPIMYVCVGIDTINLSCGGIKQYKLSYKIGVNTSVSNKN